MSDDKVVRVFRPAYRRFISPTEAAPRRQQEARGQVAKVIENEWRRWSARGAQEESNEQRRQGYSKFCADPGVATGVSARFRATDGARGSTTHRGQ
jgi:hypothetical protein